MNLREAQNLAYEKMDHYGLHAWGFFFDNSVRRFGCCRFGAKKISLSRQLVSINTPERVLNTILHEIAHALSIRDHGRLGGGHGSLWRSKCRVVGIEPRVCWSEENTVAPVLKWVAVCPNGCSTPKARRSNRKGSCGPCGHGRYNADLVLAYKPNPEYSR